MIEFMSDWDRARRFVEQEDNVLDLGISYSYDTDSNSDSLRLENGKPLMLEESSSGVQSLLPMFVHLDYLTHGQYKDNSRKISYEQKEERKNLLSTIYRKLYKKKLQDGAMRAVLTIDGVDYSFSENKHEKRFREIYDHYTKTDHSEIFLEEPEDNLFPPTQCQLMIWMIKRVQEHNDVLFIASHSPYVLNQLIKLDPKGLTVFFTYPSEGKERLYDVRQLTEQEVHEIYDNGVDMFFNFELYV